MAAYYNENDPFAAAWLRELIAAGLIAPGEVDERSIEDVSADDLTGFQQCHFFAGIGVWSHALRLAGWPDDRMVWTGSCPCPPFSSAGKQFRCPVCNTGSPVPNAVRTGAFNCIRCRHEWQADSRHLFPEFFRLIRDGRPPIVLGEQVASKDGRTWIDVVRASLEMVGYTVGHPDVPAAGFGAPHIRQRLWFVGLEYDASDGRIERWPEPSEWSAELRCGTDRMADATSSRRQQQPDAGPAKLFRETTNSKEQMQQSGADSTRFSRLADDDDAGLEGRRQPGCGRTAECIIGESGVAGIGPGPLNGFWRDADWLLCRDGRWRPVEPGTFPLAHGVANRVGLLRGAGNAIVAEQAQGFIEAVMDALAGN